MTTTRYDLEHRLRLHFENDTYYSTDDILNSIQDGYDEVTAFSGCILKSATFPILNNLSYYDMIALFPDFLSVYVMFNSVTKRWMIPASVRKLDQVRPDWETAAGTPEYFVPINHRYMCLFRKPVVDSYGSMYLFYKAIAPALSSQTDTILIPDDFVSALSDYCITDLWEQQQEFTKGGMHLEAYVRNLKQLQNWVHNQRVPDRLSSLK